MSVTHSPSPIANCPMSVTHSPSPIANSPLLGVPCWYALRTRARHEKQVRDRLAVQGVEQLLPTVFRLSQWKDRKKEIEVPLFLGYCFARFPWPERLAVLTVSGVVEIVGARQRPEPVPDEEIDAI